MKHAGKACGDLWGQSTILEAVIGKTRNREGRGITLTIMIIFLLFGRRFISCPKVIYFTWEPTLGMP